MKFLEATAKAREFQAVYDEALVAFRAAKKQEGRWRLPNDDELPPTYVVIRKGWRGDDGDYTQYAVLERDGTVRIWGAGMMIVPPGFVADLAPVEDLAADDWELAMIDNDY